MGGGSAGGQVVALVDAGAPHGAGDLDGCDRREMVQPALAFLLVRAPQFAFEAYGHGGHGSERAAVLPLSQNAAVCTNLAKGRRTDLGE
jgi:hypothetical protein